MNGYSDWNSVAWIAITDIRFVSLSCSILLCTSTLIKWWCSEGKETPAHFVLSTVSARSVELTTRNTLNSCVGCSTNTWASLLTGNEQPVLMMYKYYIVAEMHRCWTMLVSNLIEPFSLLYFRIYINFVDMDAANVGWDNNTFGWNWGHYTNIENHSNIFLHVQAHLKQRLLIDQRSEKHLAEPFWLAHVCVDLNAIKQTL